MVNWWHETTNTCENHISTELLAETTNDCKSYAFVWTSHLPTATDISSHWTIAQQGTDSRMKESPSGMMNEDIQQWHHTYLIPECLPACTILNSNLSAVKTNALVQRVLLLNRLLHGPCAVSEIIQSVLFQYKVHHKIVSVTTAGEIMNYYNQLYFTN